MMKKLRYLFSTFLLLLVAGVTWAGSITFADLNLENGVQYTDPFDGGDFTVTFAGGGNDGKYYNTGSGIRVYGDGTMTIAAKSGKVVTGITVTYSGESYMPTDDTVVNTGTYTAKTGVWSGSASSVVFTRPTGSGHWRVQKIEVTVSSGDTPSVPVDPTVIFDADPFEIEVGATATNAITKPADLTVSFISDNEDIAEVDATTGEVTGIDEGEATITASWSATTAYNSGRKSYVVNVVAATVSSEEWVETNLADLTSSDVFVIVGNNDKNYAMTNDKGTSSAPAASAVTVSGTKITSAVADNLKWNISGDANNGYTFYPNGSTNTWLYCTNTNNGVRVGGNTDKTFNIIDGYLYHNGTRRYVGIYNSSDWRCYTSINDNIKSQTFKFYKKVTDSSSPSITASNVELAYDATSGEIEYTISNPVAGTALNATSEADWISDITVAADKVTFTTSENNAATPRTANVILSYPYNNEDITKTVTVTQASNPDYTMTIAEVRAQGTGTVKTKGIVTSCVGTTAYIQDATAAICVYGSELTVGDEIVVEGTLSTFHGLLEITSPVITVKSNDNPVTPTIMTIAEINTSTNQGWLVKIENATVTEKDGQNTTIAQGENTIVVRGISSEVEYAVNDVITLAGNIGCYDVAQIANPRDVTVQTPEVTKYYLMGIGGDWNNGVEFTYDASSNTYTLADQAIDAATQVKIMDSNNNWYGTAADGLYWVTADNHTDIVMTTGNSEPNYYFNEAGTYTFTISFSDTDAPLLTVTGWPEPKYYLHYGTGNDWSDAEFTYNDEAGTYTATLPVVDGTEFKVKYGLESASEFTWYGGDKGNEPTCRIHDEWYKDIPLITPGDNFEIQLSEPTTLTFTLTANPTGAPTLTVTGWPVEESNSTIYKRVTDASELADGDEIIFVGQYQQGDANDGYYSMNNASSNNNRRGSKIECDGTWATIVDDVVPYTLVQVAEPNAIFWQFKDADGKYLTSVTTNNNYLKLTENPDDNAKAAISFKDGTTSVVFQGTGERKTMQFNENKGQDNRIFACYTGATQKPVAIYKKTVITSVDVTIGATGYATMYYGDMNLVVPEGVVAKTYTVNDGLKESTTYVATNVIPAGTGVVLEGEQGTYTFNVTLDNGKGDNDNMLKGTDAATTIAEEGYKYYILSMNKDKTKVGFYFQTEGGASVNNGAHKAYLAVPEAAAGGAKGWSFDGEATGIRSIEAGAGVENAVIYNLSGVRMNSQNLPKGIYIVNGKKMVVK